MSLLALRQPMAVDLRFLAASLKLSNDLERVGDHGVNIAGNALRLCEQSRIPLPGEILELAAMATAMLREAIDAFVRADAASARALILKDDLVDELNRRIFHQLMSKMRSDPEGLSCYIEWIMIARNLERVADLATNMAEEVVFIAEARIIKHHVGTSETGEGDRRGSPSARQQPEPNL